MRVITTAALASLIAVAPLASVAATPVADPAATYPTEERDDDRDFPWGLLGLLGLAGLLGLKGRDRDDGRVRNDDTSRR